MIEYSKINCGSQPIHHVNKHEIVFHNLQVSTCIFSRQASLARQAFLITPLHGARYKTGKKLKPKSSAV